MTSYYQCDNCRKTSSEHELVWVGEEGDDQGPRIHHNISGLGLLRYLE